MSKMWLAGCGVLAAIVLIGVAGCQHQDNDQTGAPTQSLYNRLGGEKNIEAVVDEFVSLAMEDSRVNFTRKGTPNEFQPTMDNLDKLKKHLTQFICKASGGPQTYQGKDMKEAHAGMGITLAEFDAAAADLAKAMDKCGVPNQEKEDLMTVVETTRWDIVEKK
jgi:hemoglobin